MTVVFVASECAPIAKVGGLADVVGSLPKALEKLGVEVKIILPFYGIIDRNKYQPEKIGNFEAFFDDQLENFGVFKTLLPNSQVEVFLIENPLYSGGVYLAADATPKGIDEVKRFSFLSLAALEFLKTAPFEIDVIQSHDWHTALIPTLLQAKFANSKLKKAATVLTIHNLGAKYQGIAKGGFLHSLDLEPEAILPLRLLKRVGIFKRLNLLEEGIGKADFLNTVSPKYASEILTEEFGGRLAPILNQKRDRLVGILNGIDYGVFDPKKDPKIKKNYDLSIWPEGKKANKKALEERLGFDHDGKILAGMVSRLDDQKGLDLVLQVMDEIKEMGIKLAILGKGDPRFERRFGRFCKKNPKDASCTFKFDPNLANLIYAGSDIFLMPSRFEPCGLGQMIAMRYGTVPIVRDVGGLHDTVRDGETGFKFKNYDTGSLVVAVKRAKETFENKASWSKMVDNAMREDFSWAKSAKEYVKLYEKAVEYKALGNRE